MQKKLTVVLLVYLLALGFVGAFGAMAGRGNEPSLTYKVPGNEADDRLEKLFEEVILKASRDMLPGNEPMAAPDQGSTAREPALAETAPLAQNIWTRIWNRITGRTPTQATPEKLVSEGTIQRAQEQITLTDRAAVLNIVRKRLTSSDIGRLLEFSRGGIDAGEKDEVLDLLRQRLTADEFDLLAGMYGKYR